MSEQNSNTKQRELNYRALIPFYILWDTDLNSNDLRFYGQIEQMESNPNPNVKASFSYNWIADALGINRRNAIKIANKLKKKGYITRTKINDKDYSWNTVKVGVIVSPSDTPLVSPSDTPLVSPSDTQNTKKINTKKINKDNSESNDSPVVTCEELIEVYIEEFPELAHPRNPKNPPKELTKVLNTAIKAWPTQISSSNKPLTIDIFKKFLQALKEMKYWRLTPDYDCGLKYLMRINHIQDCIEKIIAHEKRGNHA